MEDLSLHILDIVENSIKAGAKNVSIKITIQTKKNLLEIEIKDNGKGMTKEEIEKVLDPFYTTSNKKVGLGLALFNESVKKANGKLKITSTLNKGTKIKANFNINNIDMIPIGNIGDTLTTLIVGNPEIKFKFTHIHNNKNYSLDTKKLKNKNIDTLILLKKLKSELENYKNFLGTTKGDIYGI